MTGTPVVSRTVQDYLLKVYQYILVCLYLSGDEMAISTDMPILEKMT